MVRQARIEYSGALYHITSRGNAKQDIFVNDEDRLEFLDVLRKARNRYNAVIYA
jgi:putative transposase